MDIKVLGTGCANCKNTIALIEQVAQGQGRAGHARARSRTCATSWATASCRTPGVVIDGKVVHAGGVPSRDKIEQWPEQPEEQAR